jgi:hypothetical protein
MDVASGSSLLEKIIPPTLTLLVTTSFSILVGVYLEKFKNKLIFLKYSMVFSQLGTTIKDTYWGDIQVTINGRLTNYLDFVTVTIVNDSSSDVPKDIYMDVWVNPQSQILGYSGNYNEIGNAILLEADYQARLDRTSQRFVEENNKKIADPNYVIPSDLQPEIDWVMKNKKIHFPIFNRNSSATINLLVESFDGKAPLVSISILQTSVKLVKQEDSEIQNKKKALQINIYQSIIYVIGLILVFLTYPDSKLLICLIVTIGVIAYFLARMLFLAFKFLKRMFW